jgi:predicted TIM-barrel fold metal-dependent hydrolase
MVGLVNSADSHVLEPVDLWQRELPPSMRDRGPVTETADGREIVYVDGTVVRRDPVAFMEAIRPPGAHDPVARLADLDGQGIWAELIFPSRALWVHLSGDPALQAACCEVYNDWLYDEVMSRSPRLIGAAMLPVLDTADAVRELERNVRRGFQTVFLPTATPEGREYNREDWQPVWAEITGLGALLWGSDYPHLEGTYPNTQAVLADIFDGVPDEIRTAITGGNFARLFAVPDPAAAAS